MSDPLKGWIRMTESGIEQQFGAEYLDWNRRSEPPEVVYTTEYNEGQYITVRVLPAAAENQNIVSVDVDGIDEEGVEYELQYVG